MTPSDAAFLAAVEDFLTSSDLTIPIPSDYDDSRNRTTSPTAEAPSKHIAPHLQPTRRTRLRTKSSMGPDAKRDLEREKDRNRRRTYRKR
ncbi:hypothetical protein PR003_g32454, partial [Phytophthora rubi]